MSNATSNRLPIRAAAKATRKGREFIRKLIDDGEVTAYRTGGRDDAPWLSVDIGEVEAAIRRTEIYVPKKQQKYGRRIRRQASFENLHPAAAAM